MKRKMLSLLLTAAMLLSLGSAAAAAGGPHWAQSAADRWQEAGVIQGDATGDLRLDDSLTRAELATVFVNLLGLTEEAPNTYADLTGGEWYAPAILKCTAAGIMQGDGSNCNAGATITRQETTVMTARALGIVPAEKADLATFSDADQVADWASGYVAAMREQGIIQGMGDGTVSPAAQINRASMFTILDRAIPGYYGQAGSYQGDVSGSVLVSAPGVTLSNSKIAGDLLIAEGVGDGHVELDSVTVAGRVLVRGGGENSIIIKGDSQIGEIVVSRQNGKVRVSVEGGAEVEIIHVDDGSDAVKIEGTVGTVSISGADTDVEITGSVKEVQVAESAEGASLTVADGAEVDSVSLSAPKASLNVAGTVTKAETTQTATGAAVTVEKGAKVDTVTAAAPGTELAVSGTVSKVDVTETASGAGVSTEKGAKISSVTTNASGTTVTGEKGTVSKVTAGKDASGTTVNAGGAKVENKSEDPVKSGSGEIAPGKTGTAASEGGKPSSGSSSSSGSSGPSYTVVNDEAALKTAVANGGYIRLGGDIALVEGLKIEASKTVTLDLNGKTLSHESKNDAAGSSSTIWIKAGGSLTVNGTGIIQGTVENPGSSSYSTKAVVENDGTLVMNGGTIQTGDYVYYALTIYYNTSTTTINSGAFVISQWGTENQEGVAIGSNGTSEFAGYRLTINDGATITGGEQALYLPSAGTAIINGGMISGTKEGIEIRAGSLTVNGGTISANYERKTATTQNGATGAYTGALVVAKSKHTSAGGYAGNIDIRVLGGALTNSHQGGDAFVLFHETTNSTDHVTVEIAEGVTITGKMNIQPGFGTVGDDSLTQNGAAWVFSEASLKAALADSSIDSIVLGADITAEDAFTIPRTLTLDGNGFTISRTASEKFDTIFLVNGGTFAVNDCKLTMTANSCAETSCILIGNDSTADTVNLQDSTLKNESGNYSYGISVCRYDAVDANAGNFSVIIRDSSITANYYAVTSWTRGKLSLTVESATLNGWAAIYMNRSKAEDNTIAITGSSTLTGTQTHSGGDDDFATIAIQNTKGINLTVASDSSVIAQKSGGTAKQNCIDFGGDTQGCTATVDIAGTLAPAGADAACQHNASWQVTGTGWTDPTNV